MSIFGDPIVPHVGAPKVWSRPKVTRLAQTNLDSIAWWELDKHGDSFDLTGSDGEWLVEFAGRECYQSFHNPAERTTAGYVRNIINQRHFSVLEHVNVTYRLEGISRSLTHELIRHRHFSFSQLSQRYVDSREAWVVCPPFVLTDHELYAEWVKMTENHMGALQDFETLVEARHPDLPQKKRREAVRSLAPNSIETKMVLTGNLRTFREFLPKRLSVHAEAEIRRLAEALHKDLKVLYPEVFKNVEGD